MHPFPSEVQLASFDVMDTVLVRTVGRPEHLHELVGIALQRCGSGIEPAVWARKRVLAERDARRIHGSGEVTLDDIYAALAALLPMSPDSLEMARKTECRIELENLRPISRTLERIAAYRERGLRIAFVSDLYLPHEVIETALLQAGALQPEDLLLVSSQFGVQKQDGGLYDHLIALSNLPASCIGHTGDNPVADFRAAKLKGLLAAPYRESQLNRYELAAFHTSGREILMSAVAGCSRVVRLSRTYKSGHDRTIWEASANVAGPLLTGYVLWTLLEARERGLKTVFYLSRDGQILVRIAKVLCKELGFDIEPRYLLASRQALFVTALDPSADSFRDIFVRLVERRTLSGIASTLEIDAGELERRLPDGLGEVADTDRPLTTEEAHALAESVPGSRLEPVIASLSTKRRDALMAYLEREGFFDAPRSCIVDVGWRGNLQLFLAHALELAGRDSSPKITGLYLGLAGEPPAAAGECRAYSDQPHTFNAALVELFCAADHGSTLAYDESAPAGYVLSSEDNPEALAWGLNIQQESIVAFAEELAGLAHATAIDPRELVHVMREASTKAFVEMKRNPSVREAETYGRFLHADNATHENFIELGTHVPLAQAVISVFPGGRRDSGWPQASLLRSFSRMRLSRAGRAVLWLRSASIRIQERLKPMLILVHVAVVEAGPIPPPSA